MADFTEYVYDGLRQLTSVIEEDPDGAGTATHPITSYTYDAVGNLLTVTDPLNRTLVYTYDNMDRLKTVTEPSPGGTTTYAYDKVSNLLSVTDALSNVTSYQYNNRYFLTKVIQPTVGRVALSIVYRVAHSVCHGQGPCEAGTRPPSPTSRKPSFD